MHEGVHFDHVASVRLFGTIKHPNDGRLSMRCDVLDDVMDVMRRSAPPIGFGVLRWV